jgi:hypothetical protein
VHRCGSPHTTAVKAARELSFQGERVEKAIYGEYRSEVHLAEAESSGHGIGPALTDLKKSESERAEAMKKFDNEYRGVLDLLPEPGQDATAPGASENPGDSQAGIQPLSAGPTVLAAASVPSTPAWDNAMTFASPAWGAPDLRPETTDVAVNAVALVQPVPGSGDEMVAW